MPQAVKSLSSLGLRSVGCAPPSGTPLASLPVVPDYLGKVLRQAILIQDRFQHHPEKVRSLAPCSCTCTDRSQHRTCVIHRVSNGRQPTSMNINDPVTPI
ncbi:hypothetical protein VTN49DRAFT_964 [Thermomyces lanuginosus]|uniref:uncharacterized protein n=1 Tax=Thermomyces lanuginosus TaxID=5541 RepID=UPI003742B8DD